MNKFLDILRKYKLMKPNNPFLCLAYDTEKNKYFFPVWGEKVILNNPRKFKNVEIVTSKLFV